MGGKGSGGRRVGAVRRQCQCSQCGREVVAAPVGPLPKYCKDCRGAIEYVSQAKEAQKKPCIFCGQKCQGNYCLACRKAGLTRKVTRCACGAKILPKSSQCWDCRQRANKAKTTRVCEQCGAAFYYKANSRNAGRFCGRRCTGLHIRDIAAAKRASKPPRPIPPLRACPTCASPIMGRSRRYCRPTCSPKIYQRRRTTCEECGCPLPPRKSRNCSNCAMAARRKRAKAKPGWKEKRRIARRIAKGRRKARQRGLHAESVNHLEVFARDGWKCQLCGCNTPTRLRGGCSPNAPELDHIIPLSKGGPHTYANTQCACRRCNLDKRDNIKGQFRLAI